MVVSVEEIRDEGLSIQEPLSRELLADALTQGHDTGFRVVESTPLSANLQKMGGGVLLKGAFQLKLKTPCGRCVQDVEVSVPVSFTLNLVAEPEGASGVDEEADDDDAVVETASFDLAHVDQESFDGKKIDLDPIVREQVLLALPMHAVCREDCKGLCGMCGQDLNVQQCGCEARGIDPRLAALKNIKLN